jgi:V8-like Glu-specific endopeptidase
VDGAWNSDHDEDHDIAFVRVKPLGGRHIGDVVGYNAIRFDPGFGLRVTVTGYPTGAPKSVSGSDRTARYSDHQMRISVPGMAGGTSGGPWITGGGEVVGVIGGHDEGGEADDVSYSVYFDDSVRELYDSAFDDERHTH